MFQKMHWIVVTALMTIFVMVAFGFGHFLLSALAPEMIEQGALSYRGLGWASSAFQLGLIIFSLAVPLIEGRLNLSRLVSSSIILFGLLLIGLFFVRSEMLIVLLMFALGSLAAISWAPMANLLKEFIPATYFARAMGIASGGAAYAIVLVGTVMPIVNDKLDWSFNWLIFGAIAVALGVIGWIVVPKSQCSHHAAAALDVTSSTRSIAPSLTLLYLLMFLSGGSLTIFPTYLSVYARHEVGLNADTVGVLLSVIGAAGMFSGYVIGHIAERFTTRIGLTIGHLVAGVAMVVSVVWPIKEVLLLTTAIFGLAMFGTQAAFYAHMAAVVPRARLLSVSSIGNVSLFLGIMTFSFLSGYWKTYFGSYTWLLAIAGLLAVVIAMVTALRFGTGESIKVAYVRRGNAAVV
ncbi:MAG: MFS transporter [Gammaproteobacteria bacterium]|nr:MFS transporter [Gammaproteobacteria bacterium]